MPFVVIYAPPITYSHDELLIYRGQISAAFPKTSSFPPLIDVNGGTYIFVSMSIDRARHQIRIETGGPFHGSMAEHASPVPIIPPTVPTDAVYVDDIPGASWGSWQSQPIALENEP